MSGLAKQLWSRFGSLTIEDLPTDVKQVALHCILDWYGCALAGSSETSARLVREELATTTGPASLVGSPPKVGVLQAALINGTAGHALDFDDASTVMGGHPTVPVLPAVLALADETGATGAEIVAAFVTAVEIECRLGLAMGPGHYARGWHATSTIGVLGAAAAAARLLGLGAEAAGHALGLAASQSSGLKANFGTMAKPFHAGQAAERGLLAARLAARGFTANPGAIDGPQGLAGAAGGGEVDVGPMARRDDEWLILQTLFKYHPACYLTHSAIEAAATFRPVVSDQSIEALEITVHPSLLGVCAIPLPESGLEAKFSLAATTAFSLIGLDTTDVETYSQRCLADPRVQRLMSRTEIRTDPALRTTESRLQVKTGTGTETRSFDTGIPASDLDRQGVMLRAKFLRLAEPVLARATSEQLRDALVRFDDLPDIEAIQGLASRRSDQLGVTIRRETQAERT